MKIKKYHQTNLGAFAPKGLADDAGYIRYHDDPRYALASDERLKEWAGSFYVKPVRAAAVIEQCKRELAAWRRSHHTHGNASES